MKSYIQITIFIKTDFEWYFLQNFYQFILMSWNTKWQIHDYCTIIPLSIVQNKIFLPNKNSYPYYEYEFLFGTSIVCTFVLVARNAKIASHGFPSKGHIQGLAQNCSISSAAIFMYDTVPNHPAQSIDESHLVERGMHKCHQITINQLLWNKIIINCQ